MSGGPASALRRRLGDPERRMMVAGVLDAGVSSLATFVVGVFAARALAPALLGAYAMAFSAFTLAAVVPQAAVFTPLEVLVAAEERAARLGLLWHTLRMGLLAALLPALALPAWTLLAPAALPRDVVRALTVTAMACAFLSPVQDHVRRMLHSAGASWLAVVVAVTQLLVAGGGILLLALSGLPAWWGPFGALAAANLVSLLVGLSLAARRGAAPGAIAWRWSDVTRSGRWTLFVGLLPYATAFLVSTLVIHLAGPAVLGYVESVRIVAQPLLVLTLGLSATLSPRIVAAAQARDRGEVRRVTRQLAGVVIAASVLYAAVAGHAWPGNPLLWILPKAYVVPGLAAAMLLSVTVQALAMPGRFEMLGSRREQALALVEVYGNALRAAIGSAAAVLGAFAVPCGVLALYVGRLAGQRLSMRGYYDDANVGGPRSAERTERAVDEAPGQPRDEGRRRRLPVVRTRRASGI